MENRIDYTAPDCRSIELSARSGYMENTSFNIDDPVEGEYNWWPDNA